MAGNLPSLHRGECSVVAPECAIVAPDLRGNKVRTGAFREPDLQGFFMAMVLEPLCSVHFGGEQNRGFRQRKNPGRNENNPDFLLRRSPDLCCSKAQSGAGVFER